MTQTLNTSSKLSARRLRALLLLGCATGGLVGLASPALANPRGGEVRAGEATIGGEGTPTVRIDQTSRKAIIDWRSFSIGADEATVFNVPDAQSATLNRVRGQEISSILGRLESNGRLFVVNPNGVVFGKSARVDVAGIVATTADIANADFMADGPLRFGSAGRADARIVNQGVINVRDAGVAAFVAPRVVNDGVINARLGRVALGAGERFTLDLAGDSLIKFELGDEVAASFLGEDGAADGALVEARGAINAAGGSVLLTASAARQVVNQSVRVSAPQASSVAVENGVVRLTAGETANVLTAQSLTVRGSGEVEIAADAGVDLSGANGGSLNIAGAKVFLDGAVNLTGTQTGGRLTASATDWMSIGGAIDASGGKVAGTITAHSGGDSVLGGTLVANNSRGTGGAISVTADGRAMAMSSALLDASGLHGGSISHSATQGLLTSATYRAAGTYGKGGTIDLTSADDTTLLSAKLYAFGGVQGGRIRVGGEYQGGKGLATDDLTNTKELIVNDGVVADVSAKMGRGNGGQAIFWADDTTEFFGHIDIRGGARSGAGGFAEVSSGNTLSWSGSIESAWNGERGGQLLLDPKNINIATTLSNPTLAYTIDGTRNFFKESNNSALGVAQIGKAVSVDGNRMALGVGTGSTRDGSAGAVALITFDNSEFAGAALAGMIGKDFSGTSSADVPLLDSEGFGQSISLLGKQLAIGTSGTNSAASELDPVTTLKAKVYLFTFGDSQADKFGKPTLRMTIGRDLANTASTYDYATNGVKANNEPNKDDKIGDNNDKFGYSVALGYRTLAVGAPLDRGYTSEIVRSEAQPGAVHLFTFSDDQFGGITRVGTIGKGYTAANSGAASMDIGSKLLGLDATHTIYTGPNTSYTETRAGGSNFGSSVALDGRVLAVGAPLKDGATPALATQNSGAALLFQFNNDSFGGGTHVLTLEKGGTGPTGYDVSRLGASGGGMGDQFGQSIALRNGIMAVGAHGDDGFNDNAVDSGAVYLFALNSSYSGVAETKILGNGYTNPDPDTTAFSMPAAAEFGYAVSLAANGNLAVSGRRGSTGSTTGQNSGTTYLFKAGGGTLNNPLTYGNDPSATVTISPFALAAILNAGTSVTLQANNDINVNAAINVNNPNGDGGSLVLAAGRSIFVNAGITSDNGNVSLLANDLTSNGVQLAHRDAGTGQILFGGGGFINAGNGTVKLEVRDGTWSGDINVGNITAGFVEILNNGANPGSVTIQSGKQITASGAGNAIVISGKNFFNDAGATALNLTGNGRFLVYSQNWNAGSFTRGSLGGGNLYGRTYANTAPGTVTQTGSQFIFQSQPTLTVTAASASRAYGDANPSFTYGVTGLVNGDTQGTALSGAPSLTSVAIATDPVGTKPIVAAAGTLTSPLGYLLSFAPGTLTISKATLTVKADDKTREYGDANPTLTGVVTGYKNGENSSVFNGLTYTTAATIGSSATTYAITPGGATSTNYSFDYQPGTLTVTKALLTVTANNATREYGAVDPAFSGTITGFKNGDTSLVVGNLSYGTNATITSDVGGSYTITGTGATATNYNFTYVPGTLTITKALLTVKANDTSRFYGDADPTFTSTITGFRNGQNATNIGAPTYTTNADLMSGVGSYTITPGGATSINYNFDYQPGTLTVTKAMLTVTADNKSRTYGDPNPTLTGTITGFKNGQAVNDITGPTYSTTADAMSPVNGYTITAAGGAATNYHFTYLPGTLTVTKALLTVKADDKTREYGDANPTSTGTVTGYKNGENSSAFNGLTYTTAATIGSAASTYAITPGGATSTNYSFDYQPGTLTVTKAMLTVTANNATREYGAVDPAFGGTITGFKNGDTSLVVGSLSYGTNATINSDVGGAYTITGANATATNYNFTYVPGTLTITKALLTVKADNQSRQYGDANPALTGTITGFKNGQTVADITGPTYSTTADALSGAGTYTITAAGGASANYDFGYTTGTLTVTKALLTVTADSKSRTYGDANPALTGTITGFRNGQTIADITGPTYSTVAAATSNAGGYAITAAGGAAANYDFAYVPGTLTVTKALLTVTANDASRVYGDANPAFSGSVTGFKNGQTITDITAPTFGTGATAASNAGTYTISGTGGSATNYDFSYVPGTLTITKALLTVTAGNATREYGLADPALTGTITGFRNGDGASVVTGLGYASTAAANANVGSYAINGSGASATNYDFAYVPGTLTITKALLTVTADSKARAYGDANPALTGTIAGLRAGDTAAVATGLGYTTAATAGSNVGSYAINAAGGTATNYDFAYVPGVLTVAKALLTVTADNKTRAYGDANPALTGTITGFKNGESAGVVTGLTYATAATAASNAGSYAINASGASATNYDFAYVPGTLTVTKALLTVTANGGTREYGLANPTFGGTVTGFRNGDTSVVVSGLSYGSAATLNSNVGSYAVNGSGASAVNYDFAYVPGTLTITKALLTVTANNASRVYGDANPAFTANIAGLRAGDSAAVVSGLTLSTTATAGSNVGSYAINASSASATNYSFAYAPGTLTVTKALLTVRPDDIARLYGVANPPLTATITGFKNADTASVISGLTLSTTADATTLAGLYPIIASGASATNYDFAYQPGTFAITGAPIPDYAQRPTVTEPPETGGCAVQGGAGCESGNTNFRLPPPAPNTPTEDNGGDGALVRITGEAAYIGQTIQPQ